MKRVLITGADGFVASHLIPELARENGPEIMGVGLRDAPSANNERLEYEVTDITDFEKVESLLGAYRPDTVFHLAAQPSVALSWNDPWATYRVNLFGQLNILESIRRLGIEASIHIACSSEEYGRVSSEQMPLREHMSLNPCSHYAVSKVSQEVLGLMYFQAFGWRVMVTRGFNQAGPGQSPDFVISSFARQVALIESGRCEPVIKVGNLEARRDFTDVRDTVRAYRMIMDRGAAGATYNICSGEAVAISEVLERFLALSKVRISIENDPERQRPSDIPLVVGDSRLVREEIGWEPRIPLDQTLVDTLDCWREAVAGSASD